MRFRILSSACPVPISDRIYLSFARSLHPAPTVIDVSCGSVPSPGLHLKTEPYNPHSSGTQWGTGDGDSRAGRQASIHRQVRSCHVTSLVSRPAPAPNLKCASKRIRPFCRKGDRDEMPASMLCYAMLCVRAGKDTPPQLQHSQSVSQYRGGSCGKRANGQRLTLHFVGWWLSLCPTLTCSSSTICLFWEKREEGKAEQGKARPGGVGKGREERRHEHILQKERVDAG